MYAVLSLLVSAIIIVANAAALPPLNPNVASNSSSNFVTFHAVIAHGISYMHGFTGIARFVELEASYGASGAINPYAAPHDIRLIFDASTPSKDQIIILDSDVTSPTGWGDPKPRPGDRYSRARKTIEWQTTQLTIQDAWQCLFNKGIDRRWFSIKGLELAYPSKAFYYLFELDPSGKGAEALAGADGTCEQVDWPRFSTNMTEDGICESDKSAMSGGNSSSLPCALGDSTTTISRRRP